MVARAIHLTATGTAQATGPGTLYGVTLTAGSADATAVVRDGGSSGTIIAALAAKAGTTAETRIARPFATDVHVTLSGTGATVEVFV